MLELNTVSRGVVRMYLFAHGLWVGNGCAEETVPLQSAVESGPVIVAVSGVG